MKRKLLFSFFICYAMLVSAQCNDPYKPFDKFSNDTTAFLRYNFSKRATCYKDKTVAQVLADLQLKPKSYTPLSSVHKGKYRGITIYVDNFATYERIENPKKKIQCIYIYWKDLLSYAEAQKLLRTYDEDIWLQEHYEFFKNNIVGKVAYYE